MGFYILDLIGSLSVQVLVAGFLNMKIYLRAK
jgi:hypothetical protein